jgi:two-component system, sensor histidine kinase and response regulator
MSLLQTIRSKIKYIGYSDQLSDYETKRLVIFNSLNFTGFCAAVIRFTFTCFFTPDYYSYYATASNLAIIFVLVIIAWLMHLRHYVAATISSLSLIPASLAVSGILTHDSGTDMYLIICMMMSFFFLHRIKNIAISFTYGLVLFLYLRFNPPAPEESPATQNIAFFYNLLNYISAISMIFYTMYIIKYQVWKYEKSIREKKEMLRFNNVSLLAKTKKIEVQSISLQQKNAELMQLNTVKVKLFSVISHDLRTSVYALKNVMTAFSNAGFSKEEMIKSLPGVINEIDKCAELMDNMLIWARNQLHESNIVFQHLDLGRLTDNAFKIYFKKAEEKGIRLINNTPPGTGIYADADMMNAILRNLTGNAVKFTNPGGFIEITAEKITGATKLSVKDDGVGISEEGIKKIFAERYYTTPGTGKETGTGLGLMICRDFVKSNNGEFSIVSNPGEGTCIIITIPDFTDD